MATQMMVLNPTRTESERYSCPSCSKSFVRKAHMLRHQQQHAAQKPFNCSFCSKAFKRSDVLRAHQFRCKERGDAPVPEGHSKGRKRSSCASCVKLRTRCDQETPCSRCQELGKECIRASGTQASPTKRSDASRPKSRDAIPIAHLLNSPPDDDFGGRFPVPGTLSTQADDDEVNEPDAEDDSEASHWSEEMEYNDPYTGAPETAFDSFFDGLGEPLAHLFMGHPFGPYFQPPITETLTFNPGMRTDHMPGLTSHNLAMSDPRLQALEPRAAEVRELLQMTAANFGSSSPEHQALLGTGPAIAMMSSAETHSLVELFFQHYHKHCPILHKPSFNPMIVPMPLLLAVIALGGMYAPDKARVERMRSLLDIIELYIYNLPGLREEYSYSVDLSQAPTEEALHDQFQMLQGAYLIIVAQYFSGNLAAKRRARRQRFTRVLDVARAFKLPQAQQPSFLVIADENSFRTWIRHEGRIRFFNVMIAFDAAMAIFNNVPPRITFAELDVQLPCEQQFWEIGSYMELASQTSMPRPRMRLLDAFQLLFVPTEEFQPLAEKTDWNCWDLLYLIHLMYVHVWRQTFSNPLLRKSIFNTPAPPNILEPLKTAMRNWKTLWDDVRPKLTSEELRGMGFETSSDSYWTLTRLILQAFDVSHVKTGANYAGSASGSASMSSPVESGNTSAQPLPPQQPLPQPAQFMYPDPMNNPASRMPVNGNYNPTAYNMAAAQAGMVPIGNAKSYNGTMPLNGNHAYLSNKMTIGQQHPTPVIAQRSGKHEDIVDSANLPPGLGLSGNYAMSSEPTSATATEFGGGLDFMPLEADCDTQGAHLKRILRGTKLSRDG